MGFFKEQQTVKSTLSDDHDLDAGEFMVELIETLEQFVADDEARDSPHPSQLTLAQIKTEWGLL